MPRLTSRPRGVSLIELMIVLTLIGLLVALALPELQAVSLRAKQAEREAMMESIIQAVNVYADAHEGRLPGGPTPDLPRNPDHAPDGSRQPFHEGLGHWTTLGLRPEGPLHYRYDVTSPAPDTVVVTAQADLDSNGQVNVKAITYKHQEGVYQRVSETQSPDPY
jgi:prepilin-type N-terminal cleavage/methylation domain-containing protein